MFWASQTLLGNDLAGFSEKKNYKTIDTGTGTSKNQVTFVDFDLIENFKLICLASVDGFFWGGGPVGFPWAWQGIHN